MELELAFGGRWGNRRPRTRRLGTFLSAVGYQLGLVVVCAQQDVPVSGADILDEVAAPKENFVDVDKAAVRRARQVEENYAKLVGERESGRWRAAFVADGDDDRWAIRRRFATLSEMRDFIRQQGAVVEVWSYGEGESPGRRLTARELAGRDPLGGAPTYSIVAYRPSQTGVVERLRIEFAPTASDEEGRSGLAYRRHRELQLEMRRILGTRDGRGGLSAPAQWDALRQSVQRRELVIGEMPERAGDARDLLHAFECSTDTRGNITGIVRAFRASQIQPRLVDGVQSVRLEAVGSAPERAAVAWQPPLPDALDLGQLQVVDALLLGHGVEMRIPNPVISDGRRWHRLEFGEPSILRRHSLARFGLLNAYMEDERKALALRKAQIDRFAEPVFAGLNIGGGIAGVGTPLGESARLGYNLLVSRRFVPEVPTVEELRELFALQMAWERHRRLGRKPPGKLSRWQIRTLKFTARRLSEAEIDDAIRSIDDRDLAAMLQLSRRQTIDQRYRLFADILTDLAKVTGETESGIIKDIFDNKVLAPNGDLSLSTLLALAFDDEVITPRSDYSLEDLANGDGPGRAWLQFFNFTIDLRAVANTIYLLRKKDEADREIQKPFAHSPRVSDLAAYEIRVFGYPLLLRYKRGLLEDDIEAYRNSYAYGVLGTKVVAQFPEQVDFYRALRAGHLGPIGFVRTPVGRGLGRRHHIESNLPVFGFRLPTGANAGKTAIIVYGMKAHHAYSETLERELHRFQQFEEVMQSGGCLERIVAHREPAALDPVAAEPRLAVGEAEARKQYTMLLGELTEYDRYLKLERWGVAKTPAEEVAFTGLGIGLRAKGVDLGAGTSPLAYVADHYGNFLYRKRVDGVPALVEAIYFPSMAALRAGRGARGGAGGWRSAP